MKSSEKQLISKISKHPKEVLRTLNEDEIANVIQLANYHYYNSDKPLFSDNVFDMIKEHLEEINPYHPILTHVGAVVEDDSRKVKLPYWMGSMDKIKSDGSVINRWRTNYTGNVVISDKLDGNSGMIYVKNGEAKLFTRGNGIEGQNISHLLPFLRNIPDLSSTKLKKYPEFTVRGELIMNKKDFKDLQHLGANGRNMVAGLLNSKIPNLEIAKHTQFVAYELVIPRHEPSKQFKLLESTGFKVVKYSSLTTDKVDATSLSQILLDRRKESEFEIDGIIVCHDGIHNRKEGENPKHAFAFKSVAMMDRAEVIIENVEWNVSKDRFMKPVITFSPVTLSGAKVRRCTAFNGKFVKENGIGPGAKIVIMRSGDVIPHIVEVIEKATPSMPDINYSWTNSGVDIVANEENAKDEVELKNLEFFFNKIKVNGLSGGILAKLHSGKIDTVGKILTVTKSQLLMLDGFKDKSAEKLVTNIQSTFESVDPISLMEASNVFGRGIGAKKIQMVANMYPEITTNTKFTASINDLVKIDGIEKKTAQLILDGIPKYWQFAQTQGLMRYHKKSQVKENVIDEKDKKFIGKGFLFTGVRNKIVEQYILSNGGEIKSSVSKNVHVLICKDPSATSSKLTSARSLGIEISSLEDFIKKHNIEV
jgi:NAD-dependent DNA ligase